jgi:hypothetical protein
MLLRPRLIAPLIATRQVIIYVLDLCILVRRWRWSSCVLSRSDGCERCRNVDWDDNVRHGHSVVGNAQESSVVSTDIHYRVRIELRNRELQRHSRYWRHWCHLWYELLVVFHEHLVPNFRHRWTGYSGMRDGRQPYRVPQQCLQLRWYGALSLSTVLAFCRMPAIVQPLVQRRCCRSAHDLTRPNPRRHG